MTENEMVGWHHWLSGREFEQTPGDSEERGSLVCCSPWSCKESDTTEQLNNWTTTTHVSDPSQAWHLLWHIPFEWGKGAHGFLSGHFTLWSQGHMVSCLGTSPSDLKVTWFSVWELHPLISRSHGFLSGNFTLWSQGHMVFCLGTSLSDLKVTWVPIWELHPLISRSKDGASPLRQDWEVQHPWQGQFEVLGEFA